MARAAVRRVVLGAALLAIGDPAHADETADGLPKLTYHTAYTAGRKTLNLGLLALEYGITDRLEIGSDPPSWAARAAIPVLIPNLHLMETIMYERPVALSARVAGYWAELKTDDGSSGSLIALAAVAVRVFSGAGSDLVARRGHLRLRARLRVRGSTTELHFGGAIAGITVQVGGMLECRLTRIFSLTATGRYQVYTGDLAFEGSGRSSIPTRPPRSTDGRWKSCSHPWQAIGGVAFLWKHIHLVAGAGYGYYFLPGPDIAYPQANDRSGRQLCGGDTPMKRFLRVAFGVLVVANGAGCVSKLEIPTPPMEAQTQAIAAIYDMPTGSLAVGNVQSTLNSVSAAIPALALDWLPNYASGLLTALDDRIKSSGLPDNPDATVETHYFILSAVIDVNRVCVGWDNPPGPAGRHTKRLHRPHRRRR